MPDGVGFPVRAIGKSLGLIVNLADSSIACRFNGGHSPEWLLGRGSVPLRKYRTGHCYRRPWCTLGYGLDRFVDFTLDAPNFHKSSLRMFFSTRIRLVEMAPFRGTLLIRSLTDNNY